MPIDVAIAILGAFTVYVAGGLFLIEPHLRSKSLRSRSLARRNTPSTHLKP
ncbi:MAG: hypothetical protein ABF296_10180 [Oceanococcaceae bacterium]